MSNVTLWILLPLFQIQTDVLMYSSLYLPEGNMTEKIGVQQYFQYLMAYGIVKGDYIQRNSKPMFTITSKNVKQKKNITIRMTNVSG